jgi:hypothetical protein
VNKAPTLCMTAALVVWGTSAGFGQETAVQFMSIPKPATPAIVSGRLLDDPIKKTVDTTRPKILRAGRVEHTELLPAATVEVPHNAPTGTTAEVARDAAVGASAPVPRHASIGAWAQRPRSAAIGAWVQRPRSATTGAWVQRARDATTGASVQTPANASTGPSAPVLPDNASSSSTAVASGMFFPVEAVPPVTLGPGRVAKVHPLSMFVEPGLPQPKSQPSSSTAPAAR